MRKTYYSIALFVLALLFLLCPNNLPADDQLPYVEGEVLVKFKRGTEINGSHHAQNLGGRGLEMVRYYRTNDIYRLKVTGGETTQNLLRRLRGAEDIEYAEPNYRKYATQVTPNDPQFNGQWGLQKIAAPQAWTLHQGDGSVILAVTDSGIDATHPDLVGNLWHNPGEICGNGLDDDGDGYADNCFGVNTLAENGDTNDEEGHGTHVAGIAGASGNNGVGVCGVNWRVSLMALKFISNGTGTVGDEIEAIEFARMNGARVMTMSFGNYFFSESEKQAIQNASGILFVAAAGNEHNNNDVHPHYPSSYDLPNLIAVAASDQGDTLASFSNFGKNSVHVAAPGVSVLSTVPDNGYDSYNGTSFSAPFVAGVAALVLAREPQLSASALKERILRTADAVPELGEKILTGGRVSAYRALAEHPTGPYVYAISPVKGPVGSSVSLRGSGFGAVQGSVIFAGDVAASITSWSGDKIVATVPVGATSGLVRVITSQGTSNGVSFEVTVYPTRLRVTYPHASSEGEQRSYLVISNPTGDAITINLTIAASYSAETTTKIISLRGFQKRIIELNTLAAGDSLWIDCQSEGFYGAGLIMTDGTEKFIAMPPMISTTGGEPGGQPR